MNKPETTPVAQPLPLFAQLLERTEARVEAGGTAPTYHCLDSECTKKYPSDGDDCLTRGW